MPDGEDQVAIREGRRFGIRLEHARNPSTSSISLSADKSYLVSGGLGGLGQQLARWLVKRGAKQIVLTSRTGLPDRSEWATIDPHTSVGRRIATIQELEATGAKLAIVTADAADEAQMTALFETFGRTLPPLGGVIHAAGVVSTQKLSTMDVESLRFVLKPKVEGAWLLHRLTQNLNLDFFVLFSSSAAILGSSGLGHYAAANSLFGHFSQHPSWIKFTSSEHQLGLVGWCWNGNQGAGTTIHADRAGSHACGNSPTSIGQPN